MMLPDHPLGFYKAVFLLFNGERCDLSPAQLTTVFLVETLFHALVVFSIRSKWPYFLRWGFAVMMFHHALFIMLKIRFRTPFLIMGSFIVGYVGSNCFRALHVLIAPQALNRVPFRKRNLLDDDNARRPALSASMNRTFDAISSLNLTVPATHERYRSSSSQSTVGSETAISATSPQEKLLDGSLSKDVGAGEEPNPRIFEWTRDSRDAMPKTHGKAIISNKINSKKKAERRDYDTTKIMSEDETLLVRMKDTIHFIVSYRGCGFSFGEGTFIPPHNRPQTRLAFCLSSGFCGVIQIVRYIFLLQLICFIVLQYNPEGKSIFFSHLPLCQRLVVSTTLHMLLGDVIMGSIQGNYNFFAAVCVGLGLGKPRDWPPVMYRPWHADSTHVFWTKHWHQIMRHTFLITGGYPLGTLARFLMGDSCALTCIGREILRCVFVLGTFLSSALAHEIPTALVFGYFDWRVFWGFTIQGVIVELERVFYKLTGRKVRGRWGMLAAYLNMAFLCQGMTDCWISRALGPSDAPLNYIRRLVFPRLDDMFSQVKLVGGG